MFARKDKAKKGTEEEQFDQKPLEVSTANADTAMKVCPVCGKPSEIIAQACSGCGTSLVARVWK
jgi:hypothetical protein